MSSMRPLIIVQARLSSKRFPNKIINPIGNTSILRFLVVSLSKISISCPIVVACPDGFQFRYINNHLSDLPSFVFAGSEYDVLSRFYQASQKYDASHIVRITADCPFVDTYMLEDMLESFLYSDYIYFSNCFSKQHKSVSDGLEIEMFTDKLLYSSFHQSSDLLDREHVTSWMRRHCPPSLVYNYTPETVTKNLFRLTLDYYEDYVVICSVFEHIKHLYRHSSSDILTLFNEKNELFKVNNHLIGL